MEIPSADVRRFDTDDGRNREGETSLLKISESLSYEGAVSLLEKVLVGQFIELVFTNLGYTPHPGFLDVVRRAADIYFAVLAWKTNRGKAVNYVLVPITDDEAEAVLAEWIGLAHLAWMDRHDITLDAAGVGNKDRLAAVNKAVRDGGFDPDLPEDQKFPAQKEVERKAIIAFEARRNPVRDAFVARDPNPCSTTDKPRRD
ncbi:MAG: hypothetical protein V1664_03930 [Candidatus Uhrbacteria bacterium]